MGTLHPLLITGRRRRSPEIGSGDFGKRRKESAMLRRFSKNTVAETDPVREDAESSLLKIRNSHCSESLLKKATLLPCRAKSPECLDRTEIE